MSIGGESYEAVRCSYMVVPSPLARGAQPPLNPDPGERVVDVLFVEGIEVMVPAEPGLLERVIDAIRVG